MANAYSDPVVLPDPQTFATTAILTGGNGAALELGKVSNYLLGNLGRNTVGQAWPDGHFTHQSDDTFAEALRYKVPIPPGCTSLTVRAAAGSTGWTGAGTNAGTIRVESTEGGGSVDIDTTATATDTYLTGTLTVGRDAGGLEELVVSLAGSGISATPETITLTSICFEPAIDATPIAATGMVGNACPLGTADIFAADDAAPAWLYQVLADNLQAFRDDYPRAIGVWSAGGASLTGTGIHHTALNQMFRWLALGRLGDGGRLLEGFETVTVHARMAGKADATSVNVNMVPSFAQQRAMSVEGAATAATAAGLAASSWQDGIARVVMLSFVGDLETLGIEFDLVRGGSPDVDSLTVLA